MSDVAIVLSHRVGLTTAIPYADSLERLGVAVRVYCLGAFDDLARSLLPRSVEVVSRSELDFSARRSRWLNTGLVGLSSLDPGLNRDQKQRFEHRSSTGALFRRGLLGISQRISPRSLNAATATMLRLGRVVIPEKQVWVVSFLTDPIALAGGRHSQVVTLIDSWDHPVRRTAGYRTDVVIGWNADIATDWQRVQGARVALSGAPLKLRYAAEASAIRRRPDKRFMFAVATSSHSSFWEQAELRLAQLVADAAGDAGWEMVLKTKPTGGQEAWIEFASRYEHVVATATPFAQTPMDYYLDDTYNEARLRELASVRFVLNTATTFGLDAACAGVPVLQLAGLGGGGLRGMASAMQNSHLQRYLISRPRDLMVVDESNVRLQLGSWLERPDSRAERYSRHIREWLLPPGGFDHAIETVTKATLDRCMSVNGRFGPERRTRW